MPNEPEKPELPSDEEIEARFSKIRENLTVQLDDVDDKLDGIISNTKADGLPKEEHEAYDDRMSQLENKIKQAKTGYRDPSIDKASLSGSLDQKSSLSTGLGLSLAYTIIGTPMLGYGAGLLINKATGTQGWHIWLTLIGSVIGIGWTVMVVNRNNDRL